VAWGEIPGLYPNLSYYARIIPGSLLPWGGGVKYPDYTRTLLLCPDYTRICPPIPTRPAGEARTLEQKGALCNDAVVLMDTCLTQCKFCFWQASQHGENKPIKHSTLAALPLFLKFFFGVFCFCFLLLDLTSQGIDRVTQFVTLMWV